MDRMERRQLGLPYAPISPEDFAEMMANVVACNPDDRAKATEEGLKLMGALLADLGYAEGVLIFGQMLEWYADE